MKYQSNNVQPYYVTFGSAEHYPYGRGEYVMVYADSEKAASETFRKNYPDHTPGVGNYAFIYSKELWDREVSDFYHGSPSDVLRDTEMYMIYNNKEVAGLASSEENAKAMAEYLSNELHCQHEYIEVYLDQIMSYAADKPHLVSFIDGKAVDEPIDDKENLLESEADEIEFE